MKLRVLLITLAAAAVAGCAGSPPVHYYTLTGPAATPRAPASVRTPAFMLEVLEVNVPPQADQPQIMMRMGEGAVTPLYSERWSAPLGDEIRAALSDTLTRELGAPDVQVIKPPQGASVWRVQVDVQRFDSTAGDSALLDATWRIRPVNLPGSSLLCRSVVRVPVATADVPAVVQGQQQAARDLALTIGSAIQSGGRNAQPASDKVQLLGCNQIPE